MILEWFWICIFWSDPDPTFFKYGFIIDYYTKIRNPSSQTVNEFLRDFWIHIKQAIYILAGFHKCIIIREFFQTTAMYNLILLVPM